MALQFIFGGAGAGKSSLLYHMIGKESSEHAEKQYFILVPDQFTLETQKTLVMQNGGRGILNIDVLSFHRLAYRVFEQLPAMERTILEDMGKTMLLRKVFLEQKEQLTYFKKGIDTPGFLDECKSFLCELEQYGVGNEEEMDALCSLGPKFEDIRLIYRCFKEKMGDTYRMAEELIPQLTKVVHEMEGIRGSVICLDGFTGFTPTQYELIERLMQLADDLYVTVTTDFQGGRGHIFRISQETVRNLTDMANRIPVEIKDPLTAGKGEEKKPWRFAEDGELAWLERNLFGRRPEVWQEETENISLYVGKRPGDEASYVARRIWWMVAREGFRYDEIAVIASDIPSYEQDIATEFDRMGIRYFMDAKKSIGANWVAEYIQAALDLVQRDMDYDTTFRFLRCGLSPLSAGQTDDLDNYVMATGKRGFSAYNKEWKRQVSCLPLEEINESRRILCDCLREFIRDMKKSRTAGDFTRALYGFLVRQEVYEKMLRRSEVFEEQGEDILAREYKNVYKVVMNFLDEMMDLMAEDAVSLEEYRRLLAAGMSEGLVGFIPPKKNQVMVGDLTRTRLKDIRVLFFMGFSDDLVPGTGQQAPGIVNFRERRRIEQMGIELAPMGERRLSNDLFYLYLNFARPSEKLIFTYSESNVSAQSRKESYILGKIRKIFPKLAVTGAEHGETPEGLLGTDRGLGFVLSGLWREEYQRGEKKESWWELWRYYMGGRDRQWMEKVLKLCLGGRREGKLSARALKALYGNELHGTITRLEQFAKCPYAYFALYGLALREREEYTVESPDLGNVVHGTLKEISEYLKERELRWRDLEEGEIPSMVEACLEKVVGNYRDVVFEQSHRIRYMVTRIRNMLNRAVWAIAEQMKRGAYEQRYSEVSFSYRDDLPSMEIDLGGEKKLLFSGIIDRIDTYEDEENVYVKVVDYKTGGVKLTLHSVYYGLQLQLVLYMAAAMDVEKKNHPEKKVQPAGMFYFYLKDPVIPWAESEHPEEELEEARLKEYRCNGYANARPEILQSLDSVFGVGGELEPGAKSACVPANVKKDGTFDAYSKVLEEKRWQEVLGHVEKLAEKFGRAIMGGDISVAPYQMGKETGCDYCGFQNMCGIERGEFSEKCRKLAVVSDDEIEWKSGEGEPADGMDDQTKTSH